MVPESSTAAKLLMTAGATLKPLQVQLSTALNKVKDAHGLRVVVNCKFTGDEISFQRIFLYPFRYNLFAVKTKNDFQSQDTMCSSSSPFMHECMDVKPTLKVTPSSTNTSPSNSHVPMMLGLTSPDSGSTA